MNYLFLIFIGAGLIAVALLCAVYFRRRSKHPLDYLWSMDESVAADPDYFRQVTLYRSPTIEKTPEETGASVRGDWANRALRRSVKIITDT